MSSTDPEVAATRLAAIAPGYLERARAAAGRLAVADGGSSDLRGAIQGVEDTAAIDVDVPTASRQPLVRIFKTAVRRAISWYLRYVGVQITAFGQAVSHLGGLLADRTEAVEIKTAELEARVSELAERVQRLERGRR